MGLFDKIKDNAKTISLKAIEATREYDEDYLAEQQAAGTTVTPAAVPQPPVVEEPAPESAEETPEPVTKPEKPAEAKPEKTDKAEPSKTIKVDKPKEETKQPVEKKVEKKDKEEAEPEAPRKSRITEVPKSSLHNYTPSYKPQPKAAASKEKAEPATSGKTVSKAARVIDVTPGKITDPTKQAIYARERAALSALASQRRLNGTVALYVTQHLNFKTRVYIDRIEYSGSFGKNIVPIEKIAWVKLRHAGTGVIVETIEGKKIVMVIKPADRLDFANSVLKVQSLQPKREKFKDDKTVRIDQLEKFSEGVDEIEKLAKLFDKGILSQEEFDAKKKQILGL